MVVQIIKFESELSEKEVVAVAEERAPQFRELPGLLQKYYIKGEKPNQYGGIYVWDTMQSLRSYRESELAASIPKAYKVKGQPTIETHEMLFQLRD